jgi:hypothetical protein
MLTRPSGRGWIASVLGAGLAALGVLIAIAVATAAITVVTVLLWWAGPARVPVVFLIYGSIAAAGCGYILGRSGPLARWSHLPGGPGQFPWPADDRAQPGLAWEPDDLAIPGPDGPPEQEEPE